MWTGESGGWPFSEMSAWRKHMMACPCAPLCLTNLGSSTTDRLVWVTGRWWRWGSGRVTTEEHGAGSWQVRREGGSDVPSTLYSRTLQTANKNLQVHGFPGEKVKKDSNKSSFLLCSQHAETLGHTHTEKMVSEHTQPAFEKKLTALGDVLFYGSLRRVVQQGSLISSRIILNSLVFLLFWKIFWHNYLTPSMS